MALHRQIIHHQLQLGNTDNWSSSIVLRAHIIAEHYRWNGEKASHLKGFGNFLFSKFLGNSIDEIAVGRGSNRIWTSVFPYSRNFCCQRPFSEGWYAPHRVDKQRVKICNYFRWGAFLCQYSPTWIDGKKHARNVYAHTREECEEKLKMLIAEMKAELAELKRQKGDRHWSNERNAAVRNAPDGCIVFWARFCYNEINWDLLLHTPLTIVLTIYYNNIYKYYL